MPRIASILPKGEGFSPQQFGAIALCVRDFTRFSTFRDDTLVIGGIASEGFGDVHYEATPRARWYQNQTCAYARGAVNIITRESVGLAEIHNRPIVLRLIADKTSCKLALHLHNDPQEMDEAKTPQQRSLLLARTDGIYCVSRYIRDRFLEGLPEGAADKLHVIYNGIEMPESVPVKENILVFAGRLTEGKGALLLAHALILALPKLPQWRAVLIGSRRHEAGRALTPHEKEITETLAPISSQVTLTGFLSHPETLATFARAAIAIVPSVWNEPFGRTALEAMAYGCAVISSGRGGLGEVTGDAALVPETLTAQGIANTILSLANDQDKRKELQSLGIKRAQQFTIAACTRTLDEARTQILQSSPA